MTLKIRLNDIFIGYVSNCKIENSSERQTTQTFSGDVSNPQKTPSRKATISRLETYQRVGDQKSASSIEISEALDAAADRSDNVIQVINTENDITKRELLSEATLDSDNVTYDPSNPETLEIVFSGKKYKRTIS